jgi:hypothetical protein
MTCEKSLERCGGWKEKREKKGDSEVTPQAIWPTLKSLTKRVVSNAPTAIHDPFGLQY